MALSGSITRHHLGNANLPIGVVFATAIVGSGVLPRAKSTTSRIQLNSDNNKAMNEQTNPKMKNVSRETCDREEFHLSAE